MKDLDNLIRLTAKLPGLGPRSARRAVLELLNKRESLMLPLARALQDAAANIKTCISCGNLDLADTCAICADEERDRSQLCVVEQVADLWAMERARIFQGRYHVLGGHLSPIDGVTPEMLRIDSLVQRAAREDIGEVILALSATVDGQTTAHYLSDLLSKQGAKVSSLALGVPVGGEVNYLDEGTLATAFRSRRASL